MLEKPKANMKKILFNGEGMLKRVEINSLQV